MLPRASAQTVVTALRDGVVASIDAEDIGIAGVWLGAGRRTKEDTVDHAAGLVLHAPVGTYVTGGAPVATLHHDASLSADRLQAARHLVEHAFVVHPDGVASGPTSRILEVLRGTMGAA